ncbi:MAG: DnaA N-terminal domain-containing protein, partial [Thermodesulfobacteriota bacterium]
MEDIWKAVLDYLNGKMSHADYRVWINPIKPVSLSGHSIEVQVPNRFFEDWLTQNYASLIKEGLFHALGRE